MNILILGSGGREHALAQKIKQSPHCNRLWVAPGNGGTARVAENLPIATTDFDQLLQVVQREQIDLIVVGPEDPLVAGVYDFFTQRGVTVIGPSKAAAQLEGSKEFSKKFMQRHGIPTASYAAFDAASIQEGIAYLQQHSLPIVLKADGLAAGKGVVICQSQSEAIAVLKDMLLNHQFGDAGNRVVVEQFLTGIELSVFVLTDGHGYQIIGHAKDYKRIGNGDTGLNTGGMGCVSPVPFATTEFMQQVEKSIIKPTIDGIRKEGLIYQGFIFFGLINVQGVPYVIEYNCRMGDPETEVVMPLLQNDLLQLFNSIGNGTLTDQQIQISNQAAATVMCVSGGYPGNYQKGLPISLPTTIPENSTIYQAGTALQNNQLVTAGGRVLTITTLAPTIQQAAAQSTQLAAQIAFANCYYRSDIGYEFGE